jgi:antitoxin ParD1/3/4
LLEFVASEIDKGDYGSASELVGDALWMLSRQRDIENEKLESLRRKLELGIGQAERGEFSDRSVIEIAASVLAEDEHV